MEFRKINQIDTHPGPLSVWIFSLKSTEFILNGFHFNTTLHWPQMYGYKIINDGILKINKILNRKIDHKFSIVQDQHNAYIF